jgi:hypothetical protein
MESRYTIIKVKEDLLLCHHRSEVESGSMWMMQPRVISRVMYIGTSYTAPNAIQNDHTDTNILVPEVPKRQEILLQSASTPTINRSQAAADSNSKGGTSGGNSAGQLKTRIGSCDENDDQDEGEDEDEDDPPVVIEKSKKTCFTRELAGLEGNLGSAWEEPEGSHRVRSRTHHCRGRSSRLEIECEKSD